jgi:heterodisulfide reductase subunit A
MPDLDVTFFKMDIQNGGRDFCPLAAQAKEEGIRFVAGLPAVIRRSTEHPGRAAFLYDDIVSGEIRQEDFDLVVLAVGMQPRADADTVADRFGLNLNADGFFETRTAAGNDTVVPGVFVAGACQAPRSIAESVAHAREAAAACYRYLQEKA